jgi:GH43 family beta-xylosidase
VNAPAICAALLLLSVTAGLTQTYTNPVGGDIRMGDPFVLRHEGRYHLYGTNAGDGFKSWASTNLTNWEPLGYAYQRTPDTWGGKTYWAPEVVRYRNRFYMVFSCQPAGAEKFSARICVAVSDQPEGPFEDLHCPLFDTGFSAIDGHIFVDSDNQPYIYYARVGVTGDPSRGELATHLYGKIYAAPLKEDLSGLAGEPVLCLTADKEWEESTTRRSRAVEGPFVFNREGCYHMTYSAGHYADPNYGIGYATADSPLGPWTKSAYNPIVSKLPSIGVSGPGHNSITLSPDGTEMFMVYHAHADPEHPSGVRTVNIDRLAFDADGQLRLLGPTRTPQPFPSGAR